MNQSFLCFFFFYEYLTHAFLDHKTDYTEIKGCPSKERKKIAGEQVDMIIILQLFTSYYSCQLPSSIPEGILIILETNAIDTPNFNYQRK